MAEVRFLTDDRDYPTRNELVIQAGGNGDWYISVVDEGTKAVTGVKICTSGGASMSVPGLTVAIARAFQAIKDAAEAGIEGATHVPD